jgi:hypothetical protein
LLLWNIHSIIIPAEYCNSAGRTTSCRFWPLGIKVTPTQQSHNVSLFQTGTSIRLIRFPQPSFLRPKIHTGSHLGSVYTFFGKCHSGFFHPAIHLSVPSGYLQLCICLPRVAAASPEKRSSRCCGATTLGPAMAFSLPRNVSRTGFRWAHLKLDDVGFQRDQMFLLHCHSGVPFHAELFLSRLGSLAFLSTPSGLLGYIFPPEIRHNCKFIGF